MSSTESSGAPAEATATSPAPAAEFPTFGSTRGSGLARGKRPSAGTAAAATTATPGYTPTAIEVVNAPREYQNPFAPAETPADPAPAPAAAAAPAPIAAPIVAEPESPVSVAPAPEKETPAELNILEPEQPKAVPAQTWESEGFRPQREPRSDRPRREERPERAPRQEIPTPEKFLYVRPGHVYVPTPSNYGGAPRESAPAAPRASAPPPAPAPAKSGGFLGWLKSLFGGAPEAPAAEENHAGEPRHDGPRSHGRHRGGRGRGQAEGQRRRSRGGRGRHHSEHRSGGDGASAT
ncbi:MAG: hypothetical protein JNG83_00595 [Opitutaceae bacterium]|nr:hypothetical protein [Opitutaceae bacterium]